jgi:hypothetical protein
VGTGKSKKLAKRMAAHKMWQALQDMPLEGNNLPQGYDDDEELAAKMCNLQGRYSGLKDSKIPTLHVQHTQKVSQFHKTLKQSNGPKLKELQVTESGPLWTHRPTLAPLPHLLNRQSFAEHSFEQQRLQLHPVPARDRQRAAVRGDVRRHRGEGPVGQEPVPGAAVHFAGGGLLRRRGQPERGPVGGGPERPRVLADHEQEVKGRRRDRRHNRNICNVLIYRFFSVYLVFRLIEMF